MTDAARIDDAAPPGKGPGDEPHEGPHEGDDSQFADDQTLSAEFVQSVSASIDGRDIEVFNFLTKDLHPADIADLIGLLREEERTALIEMSGGALPADVLAELDDDLREDVVEAMGAEKVAEAVAELDTDDAAFILEDLNEDKQAEILAEVPLEDRLALRAALEYEEDSAGRLMQREFFAAPAYWTVGQIIDRLRGVEDLPDLFYEVFVIDPSFRPVGAVPLSTLLKATRDTVIKDIMSSRDLRLIPLTMDQEEVAYAFRQYGLVSAPVVDEAGRIVGVIMVDDVVHVIDEEAEEDILKLGGVTETDLYSAAVDTAKARFPWLVVNLITAILASLVIAIFDDTIGKLVALAVLMPIVASMGGNAGTQTVTVAVRAIAMKDLSAANALRFVWKELLVGLSNGILFAILMGLLAWLWSGDLGLGLVLGAAMVINLIVAGLSGTLIPLGLEKLGVDPAIASSVFLTTVTDVVGFFAFLGLAAWLLL